MFTRETVRELSAEIEAALQTIAKRRGIQIKSGNARWLLDGTSLTLKLECAAPGKSGGPIVDKDVAAFRNLAKVYGFDVSDLGGVFVSPFNGERFKIAGLLPKSRKYPVLVERVGDGKRFKYPLAAVLKAIGRKPPEPLFGSVVIDLPNLPDID